MRTQIGRFKKKRIGLMKRLSKINVSYSQLKKSAVVVSDNSPKAISTFTTYYRFVPLGQLSKTK